MEWITDLFSGSPVVEGGLTLMLAGWLGYQLRALPGRFIDALRTWSTRVVEVRERHPLYDAWLNMVTDASIRTGGPRTLEVRSTSSYYEERAASSAFSAGSDSFWARLHGKWCRVVVCREDGSGHSHDPIRRFVIRVEVLFGTRGDVARMLEEAKTRANVVEHRQLVDLCSKHGSSSTISLPKRDPSTLCLPSGLYEGLEARMIEFAASRADYERLGIPWRIGVLLHGLPGTGNTSIAHTLASRIGRRLAVIPLADLRADEDLFSAFESVREDSIVLIEDVDCAFRQRSNNDSEGITFSGFLNCIDGVIAPQNGRILMMSTNHIEQLDPALIRPGRADIKIEVPALTEAAATDYVDRLFAHVSTRHAVVAEVMAGSERTSAVLINRLMREAWHVTPSASQTPVSKPKEPTPSGPRRRLARARRVKR